MKAADLHRLFFGNTLRLPLLTLPRGIALHIPVKTNAEIILTTAK